MASFPSTYSPSYVDPGSALGNDEPVVTPTPSFLLADTAAPVFPVNGDELTEQMSGVESDHSPLLKILPYDERHVFLCFKEPQSWPSLVEAADFDRLPRSLAMTIQSRKRDMTKKTRLTVCEGRDGTESSNGDVMLFPDMIRYKGLTHFDVDTFVLGVLVQNEVWLSGRPERLTGTHIFVCSHASHDARCGHSGPRIITRLRDELRIRGVDEDVYIRPCTHLGGRKYQANVMVFSMKIKCYASATLDDVSTLVDELSALGCLAGTDQSKMSEVSAMNTSQTVQNSVVALTHCDGGNGCLQHSDEVRGHTKTANRALTRLRSSIPETGGDTRRTGKWLQASSSWSISWEREDTLAALAVVGAATSIAVAYHLYRIHAAH